MIKISLHVWLWWLCLVLSSGSVAAQVPNVLNYQGRVVIHSANFEGPGQFKFALVNTNGSSTYWSNNGTSVAGNEPTEAVTLAITKGVYSVMLGDTSVANMTAIAPYIFTNADIRLRVWFNDGTNGFEMMPPDSRMGSPGAAIIAGTVVDRAITSAKLAPSAVDASVLTNGAFSEARLSSNVALLTRNNSFSGSNDLTGSIRFAGTNIFTGSNFFSDINAFTNNGNSFVGSFEGDGGALTNLNRTNLTGSIADSLFSTNVALLDGTHIFSSTNRWTALVIATNETNQFSGTFFGNGGGLTGLGLNLTNVTNMNLGGSVTASNFSGDGVGLTNLIAANLSGTISTNRLSANVTVLDWISNSIFVGSFTLVQSPNAGSSPFQIITADVNGDGRLDLISANNDSDNLSVLTNNGNGIFTLKQSVSVDKSPYGVVAADVNKDGWVDLISVNTVSSTTQTYTSGTLSVLTNDGSGKFTLQQSVSTSGRFPIAVTAADVNGDGHIDLISANWTSGTLSVLTNNGRGIFTFKQSLITGANPRSVTAADVNSDGHVDLISANTSSATLSVFTNNGSGTFTLKQSPKTGAAPRWVTVADVNGDGLVDMVSANSSSDTLSVLTNSGTGTFTLKQSPAVGFGPRSVTAADVNGDGRVDLISADEVSDKLSVLTNNGSGTFTLRQSVSLGTDPYSVTAADLNSDGYMDLVSANDNANTLSVLFGTLGELPQTFKGITSLTHSSNIFTGSFAGNGAALTNLAVSAFRTSPITNGQTGVTLKGTFFGAGSGLTNINASRITGTLPNARLSSQVPLLEEDGSLALNDHNLFLKPDSDINHGVRYAETFGNESVGGGVLFGYDAGALGTAADGSENIDLYWDQNGNITARGGFIGNGSGLTNLHFTLLGNESGSGSAVTNISLNSFQSILFSNNQNGVTVSGTFSGQGSGLTNLNAATVTTAISDAQLSTNVPLLSGGKFPDSILSTNVGLLAGGQTITGTKTFSPPTGAPFTLPSSTKVTNLNVDNLDGINSTEFLRATGNDTFASTGLSFGIASQIRAAAGSAEAPSYSFDGDANTGIYSPSANAIAFSTGGTQRLILDNAEVGIGTNNPGKTLDVVGTARVSGNTTIGGTLTASGNMSVEDNLTIGAFSILTPTTNSPTSASTLNSASGYVKLTPASAVSLNATTAIASGSTAGQMLILQGTSDSNTVTIGANANTKLSAARTLGANDILTLIWNGSNWMEMSFANN